MVGTTTTPGPRFAPADPSLPHPWRALVDGNTGYIYYWNTETNITQYEKPLPPPTLPVSAGTPHALASMTSSCPVTGSGTGQGSVPLNDILADVHANGHANNGVQVNKLVPKLAAIPLHRGLQGSTGTPAAAQLAIVANGVCPGNVTGPVAFKRGNDGFDYNNQDAYKCPRVQGYSGPGTTLLFDAEAYRRQHEVSVSGEDVPAPFYSFDSTGFPPEMLRELHAAGFSSPTPIQAQSWPIALRGRDIVAIAKTGSGKTLGYLLPAFLHLQHQRNNPRISPTVLVLAPTRELVTQIQDEAMKFGKSSRITCTCVYGGAPKVQQLRDIERGVDIIIATPGRLNDFLEMKKVSLQQVSYLVLDEADRMLDMGFEPQIRKIVHEVPIRRQTLMYTATWPKEVRKIAADLLVNPVQVNIGNSDELSANKSITQHVEVVLPQEKQRRVEQILRSQDPGAKVIIFCSTKRMCDQLSRSLARDFHAAAIHGDKSQTERDWVLSQFRTGKCPVLVATDVAARGLDIKDIRVVINYDFPTGVEDYVHRIGRTGRAGATGLAHTFFSEQDGKYAKELIKVLEGANQKVPQELRDIIARGGGSSRGRGGRWESGGRGGRDGRTGYAGGRGLGDVSGGRGQWNTGNRFGNRDTRHLDMGRERGRDDARRYMDRERIHRNSRSYSRSRSRSRGRSYSRSRSPSYDRYSNGRARDRSLSPIYGSLHARSPRGISPRHATGMSSRRTKSPRRSVSPQNLVYQNRSSYKDSPLRSTSPHHIGSSLHSVSPFKGPSHQRASSPYKAQRLSSPFNSYVANYNSR